MEMDKRQRSGISKHNKKKSVGVQALFDMISISSQARGIKLS